jgi:4a-hydroxytetrahydrobiopterin dehydratase
MECDNFVKKFGELEDWKKTSDGREAYVKLFKFSDFKQAFSFMTCMAMKAEQINHHPEWENIYNKVKITLTTHDVGGISKLDYDFAIFADLCSQNFNN